MKLSTGVDLVDIERIRDAIDRHGERFIARIFTEIEQHESGGRVASLAARFAAKEATAKALGCGIGDVGWLEIEIRGDENHSPHLYLHGEGQKLAQKLGLSKWSVSLSHTEGQAIAFVVAMADSP
jgi:holo-[acyl-carrier protein] synthase